MKKHSEQTKNIYIPSIDAKDIYLSCCSTTDAQTGYNLKGRDGQYDIRKFTNSFDYSLDLIELYDIYYRKFRKKDFSFTVGNKTYSDNIINVTFKYSVKEWNQMYRNIYIKTGYDYHNLTFHDCIARNEKGEIVGIKTGENVIHPLTDFSEYFSTDSENPMQYKKIKEPKTLMNSADLRTELYTKGFFCNGKKFVRCKRSSGSARVGKCLFIYEPLLKPLLTHSSGGIIPKPGQDIDLAAYESYIALTSSSIIDTIEIKAENILVIPDYESTFTEEVIATKSIDGHLYTQKEKVRISNSIWDGQSLMDKSLFGEYRDYGMVLLRNRMFKSCCFNCNILQWFSDHNITDISQLNGITRAKKIEDIKLITTPSSIKYLKFDTLDNWLNHLYPYFGIVKHDKKTHFFDGELVQTHYQLINTCQLSSEDTQKLLAPSLDFAQKLRDNPAVVRYYIKYPDLEELTPLSGPMKSKNDVVYHLMCMNDNFTKTTYYQSFLHDLLAAFYKNLKNGHILVHGNYSTLLGNPIEMLLESIGRFDGTSQIGTGKIHSTRFPYNQTLLACRSPHVTMGNIWLPYNMENELIDRYINLTPEIVCINSIGENVLQRLSGADFDSDTVMITDNEILIHAARKNYTVFKTPTSLVSAKKVKRYYTPSQQADLDIKTSVNLIGEIINLSQELNSLLWDRMYNGASYQDVEELYFDICQLDVMSGIEIDKAKKEFDIHNKKEMDKIRKKYMPCLTNDDNKKRVPHFFAHIAKQKGYYNPEQKNYSKYHTAMDYLQTIINSFRIRNPYKKDKMPFVTILDSKKYRASNVNETQIRKIYFLIENFMAKRNLLFASVTENEEKFQRYHLLWEQLIYEVNSEKIGFSTLFKLLSSIEEEKYSKYKKILLELLFTCSNESFKKAILDSAEELEVWEKDESGSQNLYGIHFHICKKSI